MKTIIGKEAVREQIPSILQDESRYEGGCPSSVFFPETSGELQEQLKEAAAAHATVTFAGAQTGTTGGAAPVEGCRVLAFSSYNRILDVQYAVGANPVLIVEPGCTLAEIAQFLAAPACWPYPVPGSEKLADGAWFYPPDPTEMTAQLGGTVATNASGARSYRFGATRQHIHSLQIVLASGESATLTRDAAVLHSRELVTDAGTRYVIPPLPYTFTTLKNAAGYYNAANMSLIDLFIGSEGTLAAYATIGIVLHPAVQWLSGLTFFPGTAAALDFADFLRNETPVAAIELYDESALAFIEQRRKQLSIALPLFPPGGVCALFWEYAEDSENMFESRAEQWEEALLTCGSSFEKTWSGFEPHEQQLLHAFRHLMPEAVNQVVAEHKRKFPAIRKIGTDSAFPSKTFRDAYRAMAKSIAASGIPSVAFGHLGDYHMHVNLLPRTDAELTVALALYDDLMHITVRAGGTVSAEHGIGKLKKTYLRLMYGDAAIDAMRAVKGVLDPAAALNQGNLF